MFEFLVVLCDVHKNVSQSSHNWLEEAWVSKLNQSYFPLYLALRQYIPPLGLSLEQEVLALPHSNFWKEEWRNTQSKEVEGEYSLKILMVLISLILVAFLGLSMRHTASLK